jgi:branched-chain amino acid transport system substrate-binding protein
VSTPGASRIDEKEPMTKSPVPDSVDAVNHAAALHYLKAVVALGVSAAKADVARMKAMPTDDDCFGQSHPR